MIKNFKNIFRILVCILISTSCQSSKNETKNTSSQDTKVTNEGVYISHQSYGEGDLTILLVHGWCINQTYWKNQVEGLKNSYRVVTIDLPGFGESGKNRENWTIENFGEDVIAVIDQLQLCNVILVGHSMGGNVILEAANHDKVIALIGVDNFKDVGVPLSDEVEQQVADFMQMLEENFAEIAPAYAEGSLFHTSTDSLVKQRVMNDFKNSNPESAIGSLKASLKYGPKEQQQLASLKKKLYLINSNATPTQKDGLDAAGISYKVMDIDSTGHYPMIEKPQVFTQLLAEVINRIKSQN